MHRDPYGFVNQCSSKYDRKRRTAHSIPTYLLWDMSFRFSPFVRERAQYLIGLAVLSACFSIKKLQIWTLQVSVSRVIGPP